MRLEQMIDNLLGNALVHGRAPYTVCVRPHGQLVCIDVVDEGDGVPPEFRDRLFDEYSRANDKVANGSGLGLYAVRTPSPTPRAAPWSTPHSGAGARSSRSR